MRVDALDCRQRLGFLRCATASVECKDEVVYRVAMGERDNGAALRYWIRWKADPNAMEGKDK